MVIHVKDVNDNPPVFERPTYRTQITEEDDRNLPKRVLQAGVIFSCVFVFCNFCSLAPGARSRGSRSFYYTCYLFVIALSLLLFCHCCPYIIMHGIVRANPGRLRQSQREPHHGHHPREGCKRHAASF